MTKLKAKYIQAGMNIKFAYGEKDNIVNACVTHTKKDGKYILIGFKIGSVKQEICAEPNQEFEVKLRRELNVY